MSTLLKNDKAIFNGFNYDALDFLFVYLAEAHDLKDLLDSDGSTEKYHLKEKYSLVVMDLLKFINPVPDDIRNWEKDWNKKSYPLDYWKNKFFYLSIALKEKMLIYFNYKCKALDKFIDN